MSEPRHLDGGKPARLRLLTRQPGAHRATRPLALAKGPQVRVPDLDDLDELNAELEALVAAASQDRHPAGQLRSPRP
ncbi:MAG TPA: hypothetical protein VH373_18985 [Jatrophihabitantaceae bacterium]|jgi:hypothetical protein